MTTPSLKINSERLRADFDALAEIGATHAGGVSRLALSNEDFEARSWFANRIEEAGLLVHDDDVGNLSGILLCPYEDAKTLLLGSHLDTVPNGGRYDGALGVLSALEVLRTVKENRVQLAVHLEAIDFTDDEGNWQGLFGSMGLTGQITPAHINDAIEDHGAFRAALYRAGIRPQDVGKAKRDPDSVVGYLELHIEQGYRLERAKVDIGVVTRIVGRTTYHLTFFGEAAHAGTTAMRDRHDALHGAAEFIRRCYDVIDEQFDEGVINCGDIEVRPGSFNIVPEEARLLVEVRHPDPDMLVRMEEMLVRIAHECATEFRLNLTPKRVVHRTSAPMDDGVMEAIERACKKARVKNTRLVSYAGHDAQMMAGFTPAGMIFVPSVGGISHNPKEFTHWENVEKGANILLQAALDLALKS